MRKTFLNFNSISVSIDKSCKSEDKCKKLLVFLQIVHIDINSQSVFVGPPALFEVCISLYNLLCVGGKAGQDLLIGQCMFQSPLSE